MDEKLWIRPNNTLTSPWGFGFKVMSGNYKLGISKADGGANRSFKKQATLMAI